MLLITFSSINGAMTAPLDLASRRGIHVHESARNVIRCLRIAAKLEETEKRRSTGGGRMGKIL